MPPAIVRHAVLALPLLLALTGCGGGDDGPSDDVDAASSTSVGPRFSYRTLPTATSSADFVATADAQGADGYRFQGPATFSSEPPFDLFDVYVRDESASGRYRVRALPDAGGSDALLAEMNAQGSEGYAFRGPLAFGSGTGPFETASVYVRDDAAPSTYAYEALPVVADGDAFLVQANAQGERGYRYLSPLAFGGGTDLRAFYVLDESAPGSYEYTTLPSPGSIDALVERATEQGAEGRVRRGEILSGGLGGELLTLYVRDSTRSAAVSYSAVAPADSADAFVAQAAEQGSEGQLYVGDVTAGRADASATRSLYADVTGCDCRPLSLGDPFTN